MPYRWTKKVDADEAVVVIMNSLDEKGAIPDWLRRTVQQAIWDSDPAITRYFFEELKKYAPTALKYFEERGMGAD
ncbi:MAG: hypothetical protein RQ758_01260 [Methanomicrobiaceae archaeon]|nr:hypothetical protein [Methanomicrobiaceae archaeon]